MNYAEFTKIFNKSIKEAYKDDNYCSVKIYDKFTEKLIKKI